MSWVKIKRWIFHPVKTYRDGKLEREYQRIRSGRKP